MTLDEVARSCAKFAAIRAEQSAKSPKDADLARLARVEMRSAMAWRALADAGTQSEYLSQHRLWHLLPVEADSFTIHDYAYGHAIGMAVRP